jgi:hypothetical protein
MFRISGVILLILSIQFCKKKEEPLTLPVITTNSVIEVTSTNATSGGDVKSEGGSAITARGICWNTTGLPTTDNDKSVEPGRLGNFVSYVVQLNPGTIYYVCAYATNSLGTGYGSTLSFRTSLK